MIPEIRTKQDQYTIMIPSEDYEKIYNALFVDEYLMAYSKFMKHVKIGRSCKIRADYQEWWNQKQFNIGDEIEEPSLSPKMCKNLQAYEVTSSTGYWIVFTNGYAYPFYLLDFQPIINEKLARRIIKKYNKFLKEINGG